MGIGQVITIPIFFASNAIYPLDIMPGWLRALATINPLTYEVDGLRAMMLNEGVSTYGVAADFLVLLLATAVLIAVATRMYPKLTQ